MSSNQKEFKKLNLLPTLMTSLSEQGFKTPTEIQKEGIPALLDGQSIIGVANTGSGKTLAYALPILHCLKSQEAAGQAVETPAQPRALVMVPTRELGEQVAKVFKTFTHHTRLRVRVALGGTSFAESRKNVQGPFEILIASSDRLVQMIKGEYVDLSQAQFLIFDEADQMLDQGFLPNSELIRKSCPESVRMGLFTATLTPAVQSLIDQSFQSAILINKITGRKNSDRLVTKNLIVKNGQRFPLLEKILKEKNNVGTLIFTNTREQCDALAEQMTQNGFKCGIYRGDMDAVLRKKTLKEFREGKILTLVCTDLAARGLDIPQVGRVINYHLPKILDNYTHRAGRTARGLSGGTVINLITERDEKVRAHLEGRKAIPLKEVFSKSKLNFKKEKSGASTKTAVESKNSKTPKAPSSKPAKSQAPRKNPQPRQKRQRF